MGLCGHYLLSFVIRSLGRDSAALVTLCLYVGANPAMFVTGVIQRREDVGGLVHVQKGQDVSVIKVKLH